jgi:hypothetical protein
MTKQSFCGAKKRTMAIAAAFAAAAATAIADEDTSWQANLPFDGSCTNANGDRTVAFNGRRHYGRQDPVTGKRQSIEITMSKSDFDAMVRPMLTAFDRAAAPDADGFRPGAIGESIVGVREDAENVTLRTWDGFHRGWTCVYNFS